MQIVNSRQNFLKQLSLEAIQDYCAFAELGVLYGDFSQIILDTIKPSWLVLVDPYEKNSETYQNGLTTAYSTNEDYDNVIKRFSKEIIKGKLSVYKMPSWKAVHLFPDLYFDFIYHDASHLYDDLKKDLNDWLPKSKGIICGHDYGNKEFPGVKQAVDEFCQENGFEIFLLNQNGGDYALQKL